VKNVAGYDLAKLYIGSFGTLGIIVDATLKLRPRPEAEGACWATFPALAAAARAAVAVAGSELSPVAAVLLDPLAAHACGRDAGLEAVAAPAALVVFDGLPSAVVAARDAAVGQLRAAGAQAVDTLDAPATARMLDACREARRLIASPLAVATAGVLPADVGAYLETAGAAARAAGVALAAVAQAGHGLITLILTAAGVVAPPADATAAALAQCREAARVRGGHLAIDWAPLGVRETCPVWDPPGPAIGLMRGIKARLDPAGLLNPGRFVGGI
jgi:glycolate oxidase FAD binding subunit